MVRIAPVVTEKPSPRRASADADAPQTAICRASLRGRSKESTRGEKPLRGIRCWPPPPPQVLPEAPIRCWLVPLPAAAPTFRRVVNKSPSMARVLKSGG
jgi:hypothetical protein